MISIDKDDGKPVGVSALDETQLKIADRIKNNILPSTSVAGYCSRRSKILYWCRFHSMEKVIMRLDGLVNLVVGNNNAGFYFLVK